MGGLLLIRTEEDKISRDYVADFFRPGMQTNLFHPSLQRGLH